MKLVLFQNKFFCGPYFHKCDFQANKDSFVVKTLDRKTLWEMQTPQVAWLMLKILTYELDCS